MENNYLVSKPRTTSSAGIMVLMAFIAADAAVSLGITFLLRWALEDPFASYQFLWEWIIIFACVATIVVGIMLSSVYEFSSKRI